MAAALRRICATKFSRHFARPKLAAWDSVCPSLSARFSITTAGLILIRIPEEIFPDAIFAVHLDHGDEETCYDCIDSGFYSSVMIDASHEEFEENIAITKRVVERAHAKGISVEAELGRLGGVEEDIKVDEGHACLTNLDEAVEFVRRTGCDSLAAAIGTSHGAYKFKGKQGLHVDVI